MRKNLLSSLTCLCILFAVHAQDNVISSAGGIYSDSQEEFTWTIGEAFTETLDGTNSSLTQGFQQGEILIYLNAEETGETPLYKVYPNPTHSYVTVENAVDHWDCKIFDSSGRILFNKDIDELQTQIDFSGYPAGTYILLINQSSSVKIVKH